MAEKTPTDVLIECMEQASNMNFVIVVSAGPMPTDEDGVIGRHIHLAGSGDPESLGDAAKALALLEHALEVMKRHLIVAAFDTSENMPPEPESETPSTEVPNEDQQL